jgi:ParB family chromosome partitioning protein
VSAQDIVAIPLDQIEVVDRLRALDPEGVDLIRISMAERGLINPISVRPMKGGGYRLIAGAHRLEAAKRLLAAGLREWSYISATVEDCDADEAELREIEENLCRKELSPYDEAEFYARWWMVWERQNGNLHGGDRKSSQHFADLKKKAKNPHFFELVAHKIGVHPETVRKAVKRRLKTSDEVWNALKGTDASKKAVLLDRLQRMPSPMEIIDKANAEFGGSIERALQRTPKGKITSPATTSEMLVRIEAAWPQWNAAERKTFLSGIRVLAK